MLPVAKKALLIGVSQYEAGLPPLAAAPNDVRSILRVLQNPELGAFDDMQTLVDPDLEAMQTAIARLFQSCEKGDMGLLYFSGHGITDDSDRLYLATRRTSKDTFRANAVSASFIQGIMRDHGYQRQHVLILDCCYSGAFAEGWQAKSVDVNVRQQLEVEGSVVLTSSPLRRNPSNKRVLNCRSIPVTLSRGLSQGQRIAIAMVIFRRMSCMSMRSNKCKLPSQQ
jgi:uncharacterized caspase-like protein